MKLIVIFVICSLFLGVFPPLFAGGGDIDLTVEGMVLSARLREIPLKIILEKLEREKGIWFRGDPSLLEEEVTVEFIELPLEQGLKRILSSMNYSLFFDRNERVVGVVVVAKGTVDRPLSEVEGRVSDSKRTISSSVENERGSVNRPVTKTRKGTPQGGNIKVIKEDHEDFTVIRNLTPPGGAVQVTAEEREAFTVIRNSPPPGGPVEVTEKELENFRVMRNLPPPGGYFEVSPEELENFKVIRNCPPPGS